VHFRSPAQQTKFLEHMEAIKPFPMVTEDGQEVLARGVRDIEDELRTYHRWSLPTNLVTDFLATRGFKATRARRPYPRQRLLDVIVWPTEA
jgi:hypothetical protein